MTLEEAQIYFKYDDQIDLEDQFESLLFEFKQFFISKPPVKKVFQAKLKKLQQISLAYQVLGGETQPLVYDDALTTFNTDLAIAFQDYYKVRGVLKQKIMQTSSAVDLEKMINQLIEETRLYAIQWNFNHADFDGIIVSKEPDEMLLYKELQELKSKGSVSIEAVQKLDNENVLVRESKRLSLWLKLDQDV